MTAEVPDTLKATVNSKSDLKLSFYTVFVPYGEEFILYNTLTSELAIIDKKMKKILECENFDSLSQETAVAMKSKGFITEKGIDELNIFRAERREFQCRSFSRAFHASLVMTYKCNLACPYCYETLAKNHHESMDFETADSVLAFIENQAAREQFTRKVNILFYGGEPLINWKCCLYILKQLNDAYSHIDHEIEIITNGTLFTDSIIEDMLSYDVSRLVFTLDGAQPFHDNRRVTHQGDGTYETILNAISNCKDAGFNPIVRVNADKENYRHMKDLFRDLVDRSLEGVRLDINLITYPKVTPQKGPVYCTQREDFAHILPALWRLAYKWGFPINTKPLKKSGTCMNSDLSSFIVDPLLQVYKCSEFIGIPRHVVGNITTNGIFQPNPLFYHGVARDPTYLEECADCKLLPICTESPCVALSYGQYNDYYQVYCGKTKYLFEERLKWYVEFMELLKKAENDLKNNSNQEVSLSR